MKDTICYVILFYLIILSGCTSTNESETRQISEPTPTAEAWTIQNANKNASEPVQLPQSSIDSICNEIYNYSYHCSDGSEVLVFNISYDPYEIAYFRYIPQKLPNGNYEFFRKLTPSPDIRYVNNRAEIPLSINDSKDYRFILSIDYTFADGEVNEIGKTLTFLNDEDREFNQMFGELENNSAETYCESLSPNGDLSDEEMADYLESCLYNGNMKVLDKLYQLIQDEDEDKGEVEDKKYRVELAASMVSNSSIDMSSDNPYKPEIFYGESCKDFPQGDIPDIAAKNLQTHKSFQELGAMLVEPNYDWNDIYTIPNLKDYLEYVNEEIIGVYDLDLDKDGLREILIFTPGGSMGNANWEILHLDKSGLITDSDSGWGMRDISLYQYNGNYFFTLYLMARVSKLLFRVKKSLQILS